MAKWVSQMEQLLAFHREGILTEKEAQRCARKVLESCIEEVEPEEVEPEEVEPDEEVEPEEVEPDEVDEGEESDEDYEAESYEFEGKECLKMWDSDEKIWIIVDPESGEMIGHPNDDEVERIPERESSDGGRIHASVLKQVNKFKKEHPHIETKWWNHGGVHRAYMTIWNKEQKHKRLILENHTIGVRTKKGLFTTVTDAACIKYGEHVNPDPGRWKREFQWKKWGSSPTRTFFDPAGHPVEKVQEILNKLL